MKKINRGVRTGTSNTSGQPVDYANGMWIIAKRDDLEVTMYKFYQYIRDEYPIPVMKIDVPKDKPMIGPDGEEVTFNKGDLLLCHYQGSDPKVGHKFHFANVGPAGEAGALQYAVALHKLGLRDAPVVVNNPSFLVVDGNFRKVVH